jgi:superfamily I DNA/RNA helicase
VAVIVPAGLRPDVAGALAELPQGGVAADGTGGITVLDPLETKGLEFDGVVVVEPATIAGGSSRGLRLLYVALTRAVQELTVVHTGELPAGLSVSPVGP